MVHVRTSKITFVLAALLVGVLLLAGCPGSEPQELSFETIERTRYGHWSDEEPGLVVVTSPDEADHLGRHFTDEAQRTVRTLDFETHFAAGVFWGWKHNAYQEFQIDRIIRRGDEVAVHAQAGYLMGDTEETSPYHLVRVQKVGVWNREINFKVYFDDEVVVTQTHFIP